MRYAASETPIVAAVLPAGGAVTVQILHQEANTLLSLTTHAAQVTPLPGLYQFSLGNIVDGITGLAQLVVVFTHETGKQDFVKVVVRGVYDEISKTRRLVGALL